MKINKVLFFLMIFLVVLGCSSGTEESGADAAMQGPRVTEEQRRLADIQTETLEYRLISPVVACTGEIEVPPQGMASVTAPLGGYIVDIDIVPGRFVTKGSVLAKLSNPEYIVLQQSYLETSGQLKFAEQDYARQKMLQEQNATAMRKLQESESAYSVLKARLAGLKEQLKMIGIHIEALENGSIQPEVALRAPLTGYVTEVNHHPGQFVEPREVILQIVDVRDLHLHLNVFEKDIADLKRGQSIRFRPAGGSGVMYLGEVSLVSPQRNEELRTFDVHGHIEEEDERLKPGMYVEAEILISNDSVYAVQEKALVRSGNETYVLTEEEGNYRIVAVDAGSRMDGWVEIRNYEKLRDKRMVTEGASRLFAELRASGEW